MYGRDSIGQRHEILTEYYAENLIAYKKLLLPMEIICSKFFSYKFLAYNVQAGPDGTQTTV
jgi:hypothetical protein